MRLREIITIYLAIGAPLAATHFLRRRAESGLWRALFSSAAVAALWPLSALASALARRRERRANEPESQSSASKNATGFGFEKKIESACEGLLAALRRIEELAPETLNVEREQLKRAARQARLTVERYVALALAVEQVGASAAPSAQEIELNRIAGRTGDDLLLAGRCVRRRNAARLSDHRGRARTELLHALAATRELARCEAGGADSLIPHSNLLAARRLSEAVLASYVRAIELFSLFDDTRAVMSVARLLDAESGRLRRLEALRPSNQYNLATGGKPCEPSTLPTRDPSPVHLPPRATPAG